MSDHLPDGWDTWPEEHQWRYAKLMNWMHSPAFVESLYRNLEGLRILSRPGVTFTDEQKAQIRAMSNIDAQRAILDTLTKEDDAR